MRCTKFLLPLLLLVSVSSCSYLKSDEEATRDWTASQLYTEAKSQLDNSNYEAAIKLYETLQGRFPFGRYAQQAQIETAYAYYRYEEPEQAIAAADRFIKMHPKHPNVDYVYYLKGLANFNRGIGLLERFIPSKTTERDPGASARSFYDFEVVVKQFPESRYAEDARQRMLYLRNNLAEYEMAVADYYMERNAYLAAINRARYVIENYQRTPAVPKALHLLATAYRIIGIEDLASDTERVIAANYPEQSLPQNSTRGGAMPWWRNLFQ
jgi:outer membrane protein assembly factor BamD